MKRTVPLVIASVAGVVMVLAYFVPFTQTWGETAITWFNILSAAALVLGGGNLLRVQLQQMSDRKPGWGYAAVTAIAFLVTLVIGLAKVGVFPAEKFPAYPWSGDYQQEGSALWWLYEFIITPITATMFSMLAFYVASAAFRAFRAKNLEATLLLITAVIVLLGRTYAGVWLTGGIPERLAKWTGRSPDAFAALRLDRFTDWVVMDIFNKAGFRAITIGIALGVVATSMKILLGMDRSYLGSDEE